MAAVRSSPTNGDDPQKRRKPRPIKKRGPSLENVEMIAHANGNALAEMLAAIQRNDLRGWTMTPCRTRGKEPYRPNWQKELLNLEEITDIFADNPSLNLGTLTGKVSDNKFCIDLDNPIAIDIAHCDANAARKILIISKE